MINIAGRGAPDFSDFDVEHLDIKEDHAIFDLTVYIREIGGEQQVSFLYNPDLFTADRMEAMLDQYLRLLEQVVRRPDLPISRHDLSAGHPALPDPETGLSDGWHGAIHDRLTYWAQQTPGAPAVIDRSLTWTYRELEGRANAFARRLMDDGLRKGGAVAIFAERGPWLILGILAALKTGAAYTVLDPAYPESRLLAMLAAVRPHTAILLAEPGEGVRAGLAAHGTVTITQTQLAALPANGSPPGLLSEPDDIAVVSFTSGSTGEPKGVLCRHGPLTHFSPWMQDRFGITQADRFSLLSGLAHDPLQRDIFTAIWSGAAICVPGRQVLESPRALVAWLAENGITFAHLTPAMGQVLTSEPVGRALDDLRWVFFVGDRLLRGDVARLQDLSPNAGIINAYGSTETQRAVSMHIIEPGRKLPPGHEVLPLGKGIPGVQLILRNPAGDLCGVGCVACQARCRERQSPGSG
jgi:non-ribosomal peptide synthetase component F